MLFRSPWVRPLGPRGLASLVRLVIVCMDQASIPPPLSLGLPCRSGHAPQHMLLNGSLRARIVTRCRPGRHRGRLLIDASPLIHAVPCGRLLRRAWPDAMPVLFKADASADGFAIGTRTKGYLASGGFISGRCDRFQGWLDIDLDRLWLPRPPASGGFPVPSLHKFCLRLSRPTHRARRCCLRDRLGKPASSGSRHNATRPVCPPARLPLIVPSALRPIDVGPVPAPGPSGVPVCRLATPEAWANGPLLHREGLPRQARF